MTIKEVIDYFGSQKAVAEYFKVTEPAVSKWVKKNELPSRRVNELHKDKSNDLVIE